MISDDLFEEMPEAKELDVTGKYEVVWSDAAVVSAVEYLLKFPVLGLDTEDTGLDPITDRTLLIQIASPEKCYVFPTYLDLDLSPLERILTNPNILKLLHNSKFDWKFIYHHHDIYVEPMFDTMIAERLLTVGMINARKYVSLADLALKYLNITMEKTVRSGFIKRDPIANPITEKEFEYSCRDVFVLFDIYYQQIVLISEQGLGHVAELEFDTVPVMGDMELTGVLIDTEKWRSLVEKAAIRLDAVRKQIYPYLTTKNAQPTLFGVPAINLASNADLLKGLSDLGFQLESTEEEVFKAYKSKHPVFALLIEYRGWSKVVNAYGESFLDKINRKSGRLHANFNQLEADTGRSSSSKPNLQQVPGYNKKDPNSLDFRSCFIAAPGYKLIGCDYSQQELRVLAELSEDPNFAKAYTEKMENGQYMDIHTYTASMIFGIPYDQLNKESIERDRAKVLNFFLAYGGGPSALAASLDITTDKAKEIIEDFFKRFPKIKQWLNSKAKFALMNKYSLTIAGRRRYYSVPSREDPKFDEICAKIERRGKNSVIQGSSADVTKKALVIFQRAIRARKLDAKILMVVHDEIIAQVREDQAEATAKLLEECMVAAWDFYFSKIPMLVDAIIANSWTKSK